MQSTNLSAADLSTLSDTDFTRLSELVAAELARRQADSEPAIRQIICRRKDLNGRGNGAQTTRRVRLPDGSTGLASDLAEDLTGSWEWGSYLASQRQCCERGHFPAGTVVVDYSSAVRAGHKTGRADVSAGIVVAEGDPIEWGLSTKGHGSDVQVKLPTGEWVSV